MKILLRMNFPATLKLNTLLPGRRTCLHSEDTKTWHGVSPVWILFSLLILTGCETSTDSNAPPSNTETVTSLSKNRAKTQAEPIAINDEVNHRLKGQPVTTTLRLAKGHVKVGETVELSIILEVAPLWEIRTLDAIPSKIATQLDLSLPDGLQATGDWNVPKSHRSLTPDGHSVYAGENVFHQTIKIANNAASGERKVTCQVRYQACDEHRCLKPTAIKLKVLLQIE